MPATRKSRRPALLELTLLVLLMVLPIAGSAFGRGQIGSPTAEELFGKALAVLVILGVALLFGAGKWAASLPWRILVIFALVLLVAAPWAIAPLVSVPDAAILLGATLLAGLLAVDVGVVGSLRALAGSSSLLVLASFAEERWVERSTENVLGGEGLFGVDRVAGVFSDPNMFGQTAAVGVVAAVLLLIHVRRAGIAAACGALCLVGLAASQSRTAVLALLVALVVAIIRKPFARGLGLVALVVIGAFAFSLPGAEAFLTESFTRSGDANEVATFTGRTRVWGAVLEVVPERPILGHGAGSSPQVLSELIRDGRVTWPALHAHNGVLQVLLTGGVTGVVLLLASFAAWFAKQRSERRLDALVWLVIVGTLTEVLVMRAPSTYWLVLVIAFALGGAAKPATTRTR